MVPETDVIFQNDGTVILQTDGGYATRLKTSASAAWESTRAIRGNDPDNGWASNIPECRKDLTAPDFLKGHRAFLSNPKQRYWSPVHPSPAAVKCRSEFFGFYNHLIKAPLSLLIACENGDAKTAETCLKEMPNPEVFQFFLIANAMAFSEDVKMAAFSEFAKRPPVPAQDLIDVSRNVVQS